MSEREPGDYATKTQQIHKQMKDCMGGKKRSTARNGCATEKKGV
jgi:hypothetical protein